MKCWMMRWNIFITVQPEIMNKQMIDKLVEDLRCNDLHRAVILVETHISWVIICTQYAYKIKKPVRFSFVDFSTPEKRKFYCGREIILNRRLTTGIYIDVQPVRMFGNKFGIGTGQGEIIDYAVKMHKVDNSREMDKLLLLQQVTEKDIRQLAHKIVSFHLNTDIVAGKNLTSLKFEFNDLVNERDFLTEKLGDKAGKLITRCIAASNLYLEKNIFLIAKRLEDGFFRDCHGDLHSGNIFLLEEPQPFDCIEFNDELRRIDVLNEVAFLCMDLESYNRKKLADLFINDYNNHFNAMRNEEEEQLFIYYKSYRANIRAKVCSIRARSAPDKNGLQKSVAAAKNYLLKMDEYLCSLSSDGKIKNASL